jgi:lipopolysaccharide/colanic/teichoic acid biosynthesis glycosyltransferase
LNWNDASKRLLDVTVSSVGLVAGSLVLVPVMIIVWLQDFHSPFYAANRVGKDGKMFMMVKFRSMVVNADRSGVDSTSAQDPRITPLGRFIRAYKIDELPELWNVLKGDMSLVGPRPNVPREVDLYTDVERGLLTVRPGITDMASIVFSDENDILKDSKDPDIDYHQLIRPWKSRLGLLYAANRSVLLDLKLIVLTAIALLSREAALKRLQSVLCDVDADQELRRVSLREDPLRPYPPPGATQVVTHR